ncbi:hypothetical protein [Anaerocolumna sp. MB42-C2]|uniref:hypothetical protein n=1 Tax=Anaerocolumna sp. MB42-C2 TaxID=3070997 RepID=UPI0027E09251|nr:hypothetical protein [Anaerocolumna sp. MB42-C2]WMJ87239.1 hypothetical protein RBU59_24880 [Anaerocolumna sp. MB42-C2]
MNQILIPVFFTIDNKYAPYLDCAIRSMIENASKEFEYKIIVLHQELTEENIHRIEKNVKDRVCLDLPGTGDVV